MSFFESVEFMQSLALILSGALFGALFAFPLGWLSHRWHSRRAHRRAMRRKAPMIKPEWCGFDRPDRRQ